MAADSRSTHTDALATLGTIITEGEKRDAIHLGVENVIAATRLYPGYHVGWANKERTRVKVVDAYSDEAIGIVDPFLEDTINIGQRFWLIVYPRQITSLRHVWEHPSFPDSQETGGPVEAPDELKIHKTKVLLQEPQAMAKQRLMDFADSIGVDYDELLERADDFMRHGDYWSEGGRFEGTSIPDTFWDDYEKVTNTTVQPDNKYNFFSCSC
jgi:hypothetical protein